MSFYARLAAIGIVLVLTPSVLTARQNVVLNGSMESGDGPSAFDPQVADKWTEYGTNQERSGQYNLYPSGGGYSFKAFGDPLTSQVGCLQVVAGVSAGQSVTASVWLYTAANDKLSGTGEAGVVLAFLNQFDGIIGGINGIYTQKSYPLNAASAADTWIQATVTGIAPSGTAKVRMYCEMKWNGAISGACWWDDARVTINSGSNQILNGDFEAMGHSPGQSSVGITDWTGFNDQEKSPDVAFHGAASLKLGTREAYSGLYQNVGNTRDGDHIVLIARALNPSVGGLTDPSAKIGIKLEFDPAGGLAPPEENLAFDSNATTNAWAQVQLNTTVPAGIQKAKIVMINFHENAPGTIYFDNANANQGALNLLLNASFESGAGGIPDNWSRFFTDGSSYADHDCPVDPPAQDGACLVYTHGTMTAGVSQEVNVTPGQPLNISAWLYMPSAEKLSPPGRAGVKVEWVANVPPDIDICEQAGSCIDSTFTKDVWHTLKIESPTMPPGTEALMRFTNIIAKGTAISGKAYIDGCELVITNLTNRFNGADSDLDNDEDLVDFAGFQQCYNPGALGWPCLVFDSDDNGNVDTVDYEYFGARLTGP
jgi:hypothetical protein